MTVLMILIALAMGSVMCYALGVGTTDKNFVYTADQTSSITYYIVKDRGQEVSFTLGYEGNLSPYVSFSIPVQPSSWWSTGGDGLNRWLEREFDLTNVTVATLSYYAKYEIEYGWDFAYLEVSINNGTSWTQVNASGMTTYRDGGAYVGVPGAPAYTGQATNWTYETANLTPYAGNVIKLRWRYVTDSFVMETGLLVDDIKIDSIGFFDDISQGNTGWTTNGWVTTDRTGVELYSTINDTTIPITVKFNIPSNYTYNNTEEKIVVTQIHYAGEEFHGWVEAYPRIEVLMPQISRYIAPPPPSGGGGGGGGGPSSYIRAFAGKATYFTSYMSPTRTTTINPGRLIDSPVMEIAISLSRAVSNAKVEITPLPGRPTDILDLLEKVYRYIEINAPRLDERNLEEVTIRFFVTSSWMEDNEATTEDIILMRHHLGDWEELPTTFIGMEGTNYVFEATTPGFSVFAIAKRQEPVKKQTVKPEPTEKPETPDFEKLPIVGNETELEKMKEEILKKTEEAEEEKEETAEEETAIEEAPAGFAQPEIIDVVAGAVVDSIKAISEQVTGQKIEVETVDIVRPAKRLLGALIMAGFIIIILAAILADIIIQREKKRKQSKNRKKERRQRRGRRT